jgi:DNA-binding LacI/PurR family transcriptional regulator
VQHLADLGHRRIIHVDGGRAPGASARRRGYRAAMRRAGLGAQAALVAAGDTEEDGASAAREIMAAELPHAVITYNDRCAAGLLETFAQARVLVPDEVSVVGYDDSHVARLPYLRLTTIRQDTVTLAQIAVERAVGRLEGTEFPDREVVIAPRLVVRGSTALRH